MYGDDLYPRNFIVNIRRYKLGNKTFNAHESQMSFNVWCIIIIYERLKNIKSETEQIKIIYVIIR